MQQVAEYLQSVGKGNQNLQRIFIEHGNGLHQCWVGRGWLGAMNLIEMAILQEIQQ